jgi:hypothetical protein
MKKRVLILLTATVAPMVPVSRAEPDVRLADYLNALQLWWTALKNETVDILFVENSAYDLKPLSDWIDSVDASKRIKIFQFRANENLVKSFGKGAGEAEMFDQSLSNNFISGYDYILKSTGRLFIKNAESLIKNIIEKDGDWSISFRRSFDLVDTRFFIIRASLFGVYMQGLANDVNDPKGVYLEHAVFRRVCRSIADGRKWVMFNNLPRYEGFSGSDGAKYNSILKKFKYILFNLIHKINCKYGYYRYF